MLDYPKLMFLNIMMMLDEIHQQLVADLPYLRRNGGRDHIFTFHYVDVFASWKFLHVF